MMNPEHIIRRICTSTLIHLLLTRIKHVPMIHVLLYSAIKFPQHKLTQPQKHFADQPEGALYANHRKNDEQRA
jgi:hypothetical protein